MESRHHLWRFQRLHELLLGPLRISTRRLRCRVLERSLNAGNDCGTWNKTGCWMGFHPVCRQVFYFAPVASRCTRVFDRPMYGCILVRAGRLHSQCEHYAAEHRDADEGDSQQTVESSAAGMFLMLVLLLFPFFD